MNILTISKDYLDMASMIKYRDIILKDVILRKVYAEPKFEKLIDEKLADTYSKEINLRKIINKFIASIEVTENTQYFKYILPPVSINGVRLESLIAFVDYGNRSFHGFNIFNSGIEYTKNYIQLIASYLI